MTTLVYKYGVPSSFRLPDAVQEQVRMAHRLSNKMVEIEHQYLEDLAKVWRKYPAIADAEHDLEAAKEQLKQVATKMLQERIEACSTLPGDDAKSAMKAIKADIKVILQRLKAAKAEAKQSLSEDLKAVSDARREARATARQEAVNAGLYWATGTDILRKAVAAEKLVANAWRSGKQAGRKFKRWDGTGTITSQVMWQTGKPEPTPLILASEKSPWRNVFRLEQLETGREHVNAIIRVTPADASPALIIPIRMHRPLPDDGVIKQVQVTSRRTGTKIRHSVQVTVNLPDPEPDPRTSGVPVSVTLRWTKTGNEGSIKVASIRPVLPVPSALIPPDLSGVLVPAEDGSIDVIYPASWRRSTDYYEAIRGWRDQILDKIRPYIVKALEQNPELAAQLEVDPANVNRWRAHHRFQMLAAKWPEGDILNQDLHDDLMAALLDIKQHPKETTAHWKKRIDTRKSKLATLSTPALWRLRDRHLEDFQTHGATNLLDRRRDFWRRVAAFICELSSTISLDAAPVSKLREVPVLEEGDSYMEKKGRQQIQTAAPGELAAAIKHTAARSGIPVSDARLENEA